MSGTGKFKLLYRPMFGISRYIVIGPRGDILTAVNANASGAMAFLKHIYLSGRLDG